MRTISLYYRVGALLAALFSIIVIPSAGAQELRRCESRDYQYAFCRADTRGGVQLRRQLSKAQCRFNQTWGYDRRGIWVDRGCAAEFVVGGDGDRDDDRDRDVVRCESPDYQYRRCRADTRGGVKLRRQLGRASCRQGRTWGYDRQGIWVDEGCRGEFSIGGRYGNDRPGFGGGSSGLGALGEALGGMDQGSSGNRPVLRCESDDYRYRYCRADTRGGIRLQRQLSRADCVYNETWGYDRGGVWVDRGCGAEFSVRR